MGILLAAHALGGRRCPGDPSRREVDWAGREASIVVFGQRSGADAGSSGCAWDRSTQTVSPLFNSACGIATVTLVCHPQLGSSTKTGLLPDWPQSSLYRVKRKVGLPETHAGL